MFSYIKRFTTAFLSILAVMAYVAGVEWLFSSLFGAMAGVSSAAVAGILAKVFNDPQMKEMWEQEALREGENKTEFTEMEIGVTFADDGPEQSDRVPAPPILFYDGLEPVGSGRQVNIEVHKPLYDNIQDIMKKWRYSSQQRRGTEQEAERGAVKAVVDDIFLALKETEIKQGLQETANASAGKVMRRLTTLLSDNTVKRMDLGMFWSFCAGFDMHHYANIGLRNGLSNGAIPTAEAQAGVWLPPTEHPRTYVWTPGNTFINPTYNSTQTTWDDNLVTAAGNITSAAKPNLDFLRQIRSLAKREAIIPAQMRNQNGQMEEFFLVYVPIRVRDMLERDTDFMDLYQAAYQGKVRANPLLNDDDLMYKNLVIRESVRLDNPYFSFQNSFNAEGGSDSSNMTFNLSTVNGHEWADIDPGTHNIPTGSDAEGDLSDFSEVGRCFLLGANAGLRATGQDYSLERMEVTDYGNEDGVGQDKYFGQQRLDHFDNEANYNATPQSIQFLVYQGQQ